MYVDNPYNSHAQVELEEIESQAEEYPLTRAFLSLLSALLDVPPPPTLGAGHRVPGFEPYLMFVRDAVFLKFDCRAYQDQEEKVSVIKSTSVVFACVYLVMHYLVHSLPLSLSL
jgi:hypothetical protein